MTTSIMYMYIHLISLFIKFQTIYPDKYTTTVNYSTDIFIDFFKGVNLTNILTFRIRNIKRSIAITFNVSVSISILLSLLQIFCPIKNNSRATLLHKYNVKISLYFKTRKKILNCQEPIRRILSRLEFSRRKEKKKRNQ